MRNNLDKSMEHTKAYQEIRKVNKPSKQANKTTGAKKSNNVEKSKIFAAHKLLTKATPDRKIKTARKSKANLEGNQPTSEI